MIMEKILGGKHSQGQSEEAATRFLHASSQEKQEAQSNTIGNY